MDDQLKSVMKKDTDLEEQYSEYKENTEFLYQFFLRKPERLLNYIYVSSYRKLSLDQKIDLAYEALKNNWDIKILNYIVQEIFLFTDENKRAQELIDQIFSLVEAGKLDLNSLDIVMQSSYRRMMYLKNPVSAVKENTDNLKYLDKVTQEELIQILNILKERNYVFNSDDLEFLNENVFNDYKNFVYFLNNCSYDSTQIIIENVVNKFNPEELKNIFYNLDVGKNNNYIYKDMIMAKLNHNNYDINTILKDQNIYLLYQNNKEQVFQMLHELKNNNITSNIIIQMPRVDLEFINEAEQIIGSNLRIAPTANQNRGNNLNINDRIDATLPNYDVEYIKKSEQRLDMYASSVNDHLDKDGDVKSLSPLEKFIAAYLIVTKFAPYKEEDLHDKAEASRAVYEFINSNGNIKIVCAGYADLLIELLYRMGLKDAMYWEVTGDKVTSTHDDHARVMIHLVDPKYDIDGIYQIDPTWDSHDLKDKGVSHMLMSHDELTKVDPYRVTLEKLHADDYSKMSKGLHVDEAAVLFHKPIPGEKIVKAYLALERFLDKEMKMSKDGEYPLLEYCEMATKIGKREIVMQYDQEVDRELEKMTPKEMVNDYPYLAHGFKWDLQDAINKRLKENNVSLETKVRYDEEKGLQDIVVEIDTDLPYLEEISKLYKVNTRRGNVLVYNFQEKPVIDQYQDIYASIENLNEIINNMSIDKDDSNTK